MKKTILILTALLLLGSCADSQTVSECVTGSSYGFWGGLWHGMISGISFIGSLFFEDISVYALNNNGGWYDFGFLAGIGGLGFTIGKA